MKFYQRGVPDTITVPPDTLVDVMERAVRQAGRRPALVFFGRTTTYRRLGDSIDRVAESLHRLGVRRGDRVALMLPNCPQHIIAFYAVLRLGAIVVEHNPLYTARELRHMLEDHAARVVIAWDTIVPKLQEQPDDVALKVIVSVNMTDAFPRMKRLALRLPLPSVRRTRARLTQPAKHTLPWRSLLDAEPIDGSVPGPQSSADVAVIQYTSGTTGTPKGAMLTHRNLVANSIQGAAWMLGARDRKETVYATLPMFHAFGMLLGLTFGIHKQARIVLFPTPDPVLTMDAVKATTPTVIGGVPPLFDAMSAEAARRGITIPQARFCISGAMSLPQSTVDAWEAIGGALVEGYGMTESSPVTVGNPFGPNRRVGTIGLAFPSTSIRIVDTEDPDREVTQGERGELLVKGPQVFPGYWNNPEETEAILLPGDWLRTGDIVTQDEDGYVTIVDRVKEIIITNGFNVAPSEVEAVLRAHPDIADAAVVGIPHPGHGEKVIAVVVLRPGALLDVEEVRNFCRERLARYKVPRDIVAVDDLPRSLMGKVLRKQVRQDLLA